MSNTVRIRKKLIKQCDFTNMQILSSIIFIYSFSIMGMGMGMGIDTISTGMYRSG